MTIRSVRCTPLAVPLRNVYHWSSGADETAHLVLVQIELNDGQVGHGEIVCEDPLLAAGAAESLGRRFVGRDAPDLELIRHDIQTRGRWRVTPRSTNQLMSGIEAACWDAVGRSLGVPSSQFFGGRLRNSVDFFGFVQGGTAAEVGSHARELCDAGYSVLYLKVGLGRVADLARVEAVRNAIGDRALLRIDANEAWDLPTALDTIRELEQFALDWVEQPTPGDNVPVLAQVRRMVTTKIAADNAVYSRGELRNVLQAEAADAIVLSPHESGGLWEFRKMAYLAENFGIPVNRKGYLESSISTFASLQVLAAVPNLTVGNQLTHQLLAESLTVAQPSVVNGSIEIPTLPGLGFELDEDVVARAAERAAAARGR